MKLFKKRDYVKVKFTIEEANDIADMLKAEYYKEIHYFENYYGTHDEKQYKKDLKRLESMIEKMIKKISKEEII